MTLCKVVEMSRITQKLPDYDNNWAIRELAA
jgi:hypothetical protein